MTPSQLLTRIEALGSIDAKYLAKLRLQIEDPTKTVKSKEVVKFLFNKKLITKIEAQKLLAPLNDDELAQVKPVGGADSVGTSNLQTRPAEPTVETVAIPKPLTGATVDQFNDDPGDVPVRSFRPMLLLAFLNFHRRFIIGALLLAGVGYFLMQGNGSSSTDADDDGNDSVAQVSAPTSRPREITAAPSPVASPELGASELVPQTVDQQINWLLMSANKWQGKPSGNAVFTLTVRHDRIKKLLSRADLRPGQRDYCVKEYLKGLGSMSELNQNVPGGIDAIDDMIAEAAQVHEGSEDDDIAALAKAMLVGHLVRRFAENQDEESFAAFKVAFFEKRDAIANSDGAKRHLVYAIQNTISQVGDAPRLREIADAYLSDIMFWEDTIVLELAKTLYFPKVDWRSLESRIKTGSPGANTDLQILLAATKERPELPPPVYSVIVLGLKWYQDAGEEERAQRFLGQLEEVCETITSDRLLKKVQSEIDVLKAGFGE